MDFLVSSLSSSVKSVHWWRNPLAASSAKTEVNLPFAPSASANGEFKLLIDEVDKLFWKYADGRDNRTRRDNILETSILFPGTLKACMRVNIPEKNKIEYAIENSLIDGQYLPKPPGYYSSKPECNWIIFVHQKVFEFEKYDPDCEDSHWDRATEVSQQIAVLSVSDCGVWTLESESGCVWVSQWPRSDPKLWSRFQIISSSSVYFIRINIFIIQCLTLRVNIL